MRGCFVTATDTGVGKTVVAAAIAAQLTATGERVAVHKPVLTGIAEPEPGVAPDHELLAAVSGQSPETVAPLRFGPAVSPHLAARLAGVALDPAAMIAAARGAAQGVDALVVEGIGGLLVPLADDWLVIDLAVALALPVVIVARPGLGTINHTLLTLHSARAAGLDVRAVVLTPWPARPSMLERSNRETLARLGAIEVATLAALPDLSAGELARGGAPLRPQRWLSPSAAGSHSDRVAV